MDRNTRRSSSQFQSKAIAFSGMLTALSVVLMLTGGLIPVMTYASPLISGVLLLPVLLEFGKKYAWSSWGAAALITLLIGADREAAFFFLFFGYYPITKWRIDQLHGTWKKFAIKLTIFTVATAALYALLSFVLGMDAILAEFQEMSVWMTLAFVLLLDLCLLLYDRLLLPLCILYKTRIKPKLHIH